MGAENFSPTWFLLEHHHNTRFDDLKAGLSFLKRKVEGQREGQISFLKVNSKTNQRFVDLCDNDCFNSLIFEKVEYSLFEFY